MADRHTQPLFYDDIEDALREIVRSVGKPKEIGSRLWPEIDPEKAGRRLMDCLNDSRREVLSPSQVILILRIGREIDCHAAMNFIARECGYSDPTPTEPESEIARLQREFVEATKALGQMADRIGQIQTQSRSVLKVA